MPKYHVTAHRIDEHGSLARCKEAEITLDAGFAGHADAFSPAELLLAAMSAYMLKGVGRVTPILKFELRRVGVRIQACVRTCHRKWKVSCTKSSPIPMGWKNTWHCCTRMCASTAQY